MIAPGDGVRAVVHVAVAPAVAFRLFTEELDAWWRRGPRFRLAGRARGVLTLEPRVGGRLFESYAADDGERVIVAGEVQVWDPPHRLVFTWRLTNFAPDEVTEVELTFAPERRGTRVTVEHRGWSRLRADHPARHGQPVAGFLGELGRWWGQLLTALREHAATGRP